MKYGCYITHTTICSDIVESINKYFKKKHLDFDYKYDYGSFGITLSFNSPTLNYSIFEGICSVLKEHGYKLKDRPLKNFIILKKDKKHRVKIAVYATGEYGSHTEIYIIPEWKYENESSESDAT